MSAVKRWSKGFSLLELMVAITIGSFLLVGLVKIFQRANRSDAEIARAAEQIENGRYSIQLLSSELHNAGFFGPFFNLPPAPGALPDPCEVSDTTALYNALALPVQGSAAADLTSQPAIPGSCGSYGLTTANLVPGSDILVIRRADTQVLTGAPVLNEVYIQANSVDAEVQLGNPANFVLGALNTDNSVAAVGTKAAGGTAATILKKANVSGASPIDESLRIAADIRKLHVDVYFVAPCSVPANGTDICTGASDDDGSPIPTLKRLELTSVGGTTTMKMVSLVEGVERLTVDYGIDNQPNAINTVTNFPGDGVPDTYLHSPTLADWSNVVTARVHILARSITNSPGQVDAKTYDMGLIGTAAAANDSYKRHAFSQTVRLNNLSSRREIPQ